MTARRMREALGRIAVVVCDERLDARAVPPLIADIARIAESAIQPSKGLPSRPATVAAPVFEFLRRTAKAQREVETAIQHFASEAPKVKGAGRSPAPRDPIANALAWLDTGQARKAFIRTGAPYARAWLRDALEWARKNPEAKPPQLPVADPLAPPPEQGELQLGASRRGRPKGSMVLSSKTRDLALLVLYLARVKGLSLDTAIAWVRAAGRIAPDRSGLRRACERFESVDIPTDVLESLASAVAEQYRLPVDLMPHRRSAPHPRDAGQ